MNIVNWLFANIASLSPLIVIRSYQRGVEYRFGQVTRTALPPGWYWRFPYLREIERVVVTLQWIDAPVQGVQATCGTTVAVSANIGFVVKDAVAWFNDVQDAEHTLLNMARPHLTAIAGEFDYSDARDRLAGMGRLMRRRLRVELDEMGVTVIKVGITDFVPARHYRLLQDTVVN